MAQYFSTTFDSPIGKIKLTSTQNGIISLSLISSNPLINTYIFNPDVEEFSDSDTRNSLPPILYQCKNELKLYFEGKLTLFTVPVHLQGTEMQKSVWNQLSKIPYGETVSYKDLSQRSGYPRAFRAIGTAVGKNNIPIILPCHRVIRSNGELGGFALGLDKKLWLLKLEKKS